MDQQELFKLINRATREAWTELNLRSQSLTELPSDHPDTQSARQSLAAVEKQFTGKAMQVFALSMKNMSPREISVELDLTIDSVYSLKNRVKTLLMQQIKELRNELEL